MRSYRPAMTLGNTNVPFSVVCVVWFPRVTLAPDREASPSTTRPRTLPLQGTVRNANSYQAGRARPASSRALWLTRTRYGESQSRAGTERKDTVWLAPSHWNSATGIVFQGGSAPPTNEIASWVFAVSMPSSNVIDTVGSRPTSASPSFGIVLTTRGGVASGCGRVRKEDANGTPTALPFTSAAARPSETRYSTSNDRIPAGVYVTTSAPRDQENKPSASVQFRTGSWRAKASETPLRSIVSLNVSVTVEVSGTPVVPFPGSMATTRGGVVSDASVANVQTTSSRGLPSDRPFPFPSRPRPAESCADARIVVLMYAANGKFSNGLKIAVSSGNVRPSHENVPAEAFQTKERFVYENASSTEARSIGSENTISTSAVTDAFALLAAGATARTRGGVRSGSVMKRNT